MDSSFQLEVLLRMDLDINFNGKTCTPVYIKMDSQEALLPSKGVCRQLGMVTYHSGVPMLLESCNTCIETK